VILDRMYFHRNFTDYIGDANGGGTCNGNAATWECSTGYWSPTHIQYRGITRCTSARRRPARTWITSC